MKNKSKTVVVKVTALDIKNGVMQDGASCPIANALKRYTDELRVCRAPVCEVGSTEIELDFPEPTPRAIQLPAKARAFVQRFDNGQKVKPFSFRISL